MYLTEELIENVQGYGERWKELSFIFFTPRKTTIAGAGSGQAQAEAGVRGFHVAVRNAGLHLLLPVSVRKTLQLKAPARSPVDTEHL